MQYKLQTDMEQTEGQTEGNAAQPGYTKKASMARAARRRKRMQTKEPWIDRNCASITAGIVTVIVYGSLYPFSFYGNDVVGGPLRALLSTWRTSPDHYDLIANILFYMPFGFFAVRSLMRPSLTVRMGLVLVCGVALSAAMELLQVYDAGRQSSMSDVYANFAGTLLGAATSAGLAQRLQIPELRALGNRPFVPLLLLCWLGNRLFPYVPAGDLQKYWRALQPLVMVLCGFRWMFTSTWRGGLRSPFCWRRNAASGPPAWRLLRLSWAYYLHGF